MRLRLTATTMTAALAVLPVLFDGARASAADRTTEAKQLLEGFETPRRR